MAKQRAPVTLSGGQGFNFEDAVAARAMLDMLAGAVPLGEAVGTVERIDWQARDAGHLLDDIVLTLTRQAVNATAEMSAKSDRQVTEGGFPSNFVEAIWEQWLHTESEVFQRDRDLVVLVTSKLANSVAESWEKLLREAIATTPERMVARLQPPSGSEEGSHSSAIQRALFASLACPERLKDQVQDEEQQRVQLLCRVRLVHLDYFEEPSKDQARALVDCRQLVKSGSQEDAEALWNALVVIASQMRGTGGSLDHAGLLAQLREHHELHDHPDYRADWQAIQRWTGEMLDGISSTVAGSATLDRQDAFQKFADIVATNRVCLAVGESGSGKSALAKAVALRGYSSVAALPNEAFESGRAPVVDQFLGLLHPLAEVLTTSGSDCLVFLDSIDRFTDEGVRLVGRLIRSVLQDERSSHIQFLMTAQVEAADHVADALAEGGLDRADVLIHAIDAPDEQEVRELLTEFPQLSWSHLHQDMKPLLRNLKILDWLVRASRGTTEFPASSVTGLIPLIDYLWGKWVEVGNAAIARSGLLKRLALSEAQSLQVGVPLMELTHPEQLSLPDLLDSKLLHVRNERVRFGHDLLGDWARLKILIGQDPTVTPEARMRSAGLRWHRAMRLYGRWLLSQSNGAALWQTTIERVDDGSAEGAVVRDLLLEAIIVSEDSERLLREVWPILIANNGNYLNRLLDRFLFVATVPDSRIRNVVSDERAVETMGIRWRVPFWSYWPAFLLVLHENAEQVITLAGPSAAKFCKLWLRTIPVELLMAPSFPLRSQAAELALQNAQATREQSERVYLASDYQRDAYEALLFAAPVFPERVSSLVLELAERRSPPAAATDITEAAAESTEASESTEVPAANDLSYPGPRRAPWPAGPNEQVDEAFRDAVLGGTGILALASVHPEVAIEVLLAVCIEEPQYPRYQSSDVFDDFGTVHWQQGYPPFYYRGPFLAFLRAFPRQGIEFVLQLVNFASERWVDRERLHAVRQNETPPTIEQLSVPVSLSSGSTFWIGDAQVYRWHSEGANSARIVTCALMALEKWLYEQIDAGADLNASLTAIMHGSRSVAFAGLLLDVGKKALPLLTDQLRPLLAQWVFHYWDNQITHHLRTGMVPALIGWHRHSRETINEVRDWHLADHKKYPLRAIGPYLLINVPSLRPFFAETVAHWRAELAAGRAPTNLRPLIEELTFENYQATPHDDGRTSYQLIVPQELETELAARRQESAQEMMVLTFPTTCRGILDGGQLELTALESFWQTIQSIAACEVADPEMPARPADGVVGGIAVLLVNHYDWLTDQPNRLQWCMERLQEVAAAPPPRRRFDVAESVSEDHWECFLGEAGVALLARNPNDEFARRLVAQGIVAFHYRTTAKTMQRAFEHRQSLGALFVDLQYLTLHWARIRSACHRTAQLCEQVAHWRRFALGDNDDNQLPSDEQLRQDADQAAAEIPVLVEGFVSGMVPATTLQEVAALASDDLQRLNRSRRSQSRRNADSVSGRRERVHREDSGLDEAVLMHGFAWLALSHAVTTAEREAFFPQVQALQRLTLATLPRPDDPQRVELEDYPSDFDHFVQRLACVAIAQMEVGSEARSLWQPFLELPTFAHYWVANFLADWFIYGIEAAGSPAKFVGHWSEMLRFAVEAPNWTGRNSHHHRLDSMVCELLGYHYGMDLVAKNESFRPLLSRLSSEFSAAADRWFELPEVADSFARNVIHSGYHNLLPSGVQWLHQASEKTPLDRFWPDQRHEAHIIAVLRQCWEQRQAAVTNDSKLRAAFSGLITKLAARGSHDAIHLREQLLDSIGR
jgi:hypothetical protein